MSKASMNHVYRLVWSDSLGGYVPVAETTKARGKRGRTTRIVGFIAGLTMSSLAMAQGATLISGSNATVEAAQNGVPVVNIEAANGSGLSHNRFTQYNVGSEGLVLNNVTSGSAVTNLAGAIRANPNLQSAASIILNEVVENNRSLLSGYTEVGGTSADVVVANPFGITCNGCGFLNTSHVTLSTGVPQINGASLQFGISGGDIRVVGEGLDATRQNVLDLVARSVVLAGQINAQELNIAAGSGNWNRDNNSFEGGANNSGLAFDSTALGGMYANQITIRVTDQGAGVRMLGNAAATAGDLRITSNGVLEVASNISAANDIQLSTSSDDVSAVALNDASLSAGGNLNVSAVDGGGAVSEGLMFAEANLNLELASLTDTVSSVDSDEQSNRYAGGDLTLSISDELSIDGARWAGAGDVDASAETVSLTGAALVSGGELSLSAQNDLNLGDSLISSVGTLLLNAGGAVSTLAGDAQGVIAAVGDAILQAANLDNAGDIEAVEGSVTLDISEEATNSGIIRAGGDISLGGALGEGASLALTNSGTLLAGMSVNLSATEMNNSGDIQGRTDVQLQGDSLDNSGRLRAVGGESATLELRLASILNNGVVVAGTALTIAEVTNFENRDIFYAGENLTIGDADTALNFINAAEAFMQAGGTFSLDAGGSAVGEQRGSLLGETISIRAAALANAGRIQSGTDSSYVLESSLQNSGELIAGSAMNAEAGSFNNAENALIQAETGVVFNIVDSLDNAGAMYLTGQDFRPEQNSAGSTLSAANIINSGMISSNADLALNLDGEFLQNNDEISVAGSLYINSFGDGLDIRNQGGAVLQAQGNSLRVEGANVSLFNGVGGVLAGNAVELQLQNLDNLGDLVSGEGGVRIAASGEFLNSGTLSAGNDSGGDAEITANTVNNIGPAGRVQSYNNLSFNVSTSLDNSGLILAGNSLFINSNEGSLDVGNHLGGLIQASNDGNSQLLINLAGGALNNRDSAVIFADALTVNAGQINNQGVDSALQAIGDLSLTVGQLDNGALILSGLELQVDTQSLTNAGYIGAGSSSSSTIAVASPLVNSGRISFGDAANGGSGTVSTTGTLSNTAGAFIQAAGTLRLELAGAINNAGTILADIVSIVGSNLNVNNQTGGVLEGRQSLLFSAPIASLINQNQAGIYGLSGSLNLTQLTNLGDLYGSNIDLTIADTLINSGAIVLGTQGSAGTRTVSANTLENQAGGVIQSNGDLLISLSGETVENSGALLAADDLSINGNAATLTISNREQGIIQAGSDADDVLTLTHADLTLNNLDAAALLGGELQINAANLDNEGAIAGGRSNSSLVTVTTALDNAGQILFGVDPDGQGPLAGIGSGTLRTAGTLTNQVDASIQAFDDLILELTGALNNAGVVAADNVVVVGSNLAIDNQIGGVLQGFTSLGFSGSILSLQNASGAGVYGLTNNLNLASLNNQGDLFGGDIDIDITNTLTNSGTIVLGTLGAAQTRRVSANTLDNLAGGIIQSNSSLSLALTGTLLDNAGTLRGVDDLGISSTGTTLVINNTGQAAIQAGASAGDVLSISHPALTINNLGPSATLSGNQVLITAAALSNAGGILSGTSNASSIAISGALNNTGDIAIGWDPDGAQNPAPAAGSGVISAGTLTNSGSGVIQSVDDLTVRLGISLSNLGAMLSRDTLTIEGSGATLAVSNQAQGIIQAGSDAGDVLNINHAALTLSNLDDGRLLGNEIQIDAASLANAAGAAIAAGTSANSLIAVSTGLQNDGQISFGRDPDGAVGALSGTGSGTVRTAGTLTNTAGSSIQAFDNLRLELNGTLTNAGLVAADAVTIVGTNLAIVNQTNGVLQGFNSLNFSGSIASLQNAIGAGIYGLMQDLTLASLTNAGDLFGSAIDLSITNLLTNSGSILLGAAGSGNTRTVSAGTLDNQGTGTIQSNAGLLLAVSGSSLDNSGALLAADDLTVTGTGASLTLTNLSNGFIQSGSDFGDTLSLGGTALTLDNQASAQLIGNQIQIASASLSNAGVIAAGAFANNSGQAASSTITSATGFNNSGNIYFGNGTDGGSGTVNAATLDNTSTGVIQSVDTLAMNIATTLNNAGIVVSNDSFTVNGTGAALTINNNGSGVMQAGSDTGDILTLSHAALDLNNSASTAALVGNEIQISAASLQNQGSIASGTSTGSVIAVSSALTNAGNIIFGKDPDGAGAVEGSGSGTLQTSGTLTNQANASIQAFDNLTLTLAGTLTNAGAVLADAVVISGASLAIDNQANGVLQGFNSLSFSSPISSLQNAAGGGIYGLVQNLSLNSLTNNGDLFGSAIDLSISNALTNTGVILLDVNGAGSNATRNISAGTLVNHGGGIIQSNTGLALSLTGDTLNNGGGLLLAQDALHIGGTDTTLTLSNTPQGLAGRGVIQAGAGLSFSHVNLILNNGIDAVLLGESIQISSSSMSNAGRVTATGASSSSTFNIGSLDNQFDGNIQAANNLTINTNAATALTNRGDIAAHGVLSVSNSAGALNNLGNQAQIYGDQLLITVSSVNNEGTLAGGASSASAIMSTGLVDNTGNIYFSRDSDGAGPNPASGSGSLSASALTNASGSRIVAADNLTLNLQSQLNNTGVVSADTLRINASGASLQINNFAGTATNETVLSGNILELGGPGSISGLINETNAGIYGLNSNLSLDSLNNQGGLFGRDINVDVTNALTNSGNIVLGTGQINVVRRVSAGTLNNQAGGLIQSNSTLQLSLSGSTLSNAGTLLAMDDLEIVSSAAALTVNNEGANAFMQAGTAVDDLVIIQGSGITLNNLNSAVLLGGNIFFNIKEMTNSGRIAVGALLNGSSSTINTSLFVDNTLTNSGQINFGNSTDGGNGTIRANSLINLAGASIEAFGGLNLNLETTLNNSDLIEALVLSINADVNGGGLSIINNDAAVNSVLRGRNALNLSGPISSIVNGIGAGIYGVNTNLVAGSLNNQGDLFGSNIDIDITGELRNSGTLYWGTQGALGPLPDLRTLSVGTLVNLGSGIIQSTAPLDVTVRGGALTNYGTLRSDFALGIVGSDVVLDIINGDANATTTAFIVADTSSAQQGAVNIGASGTTVSLTNHTDGVVLGNTLNLTLSNLTNNGLIQGNQTGTLSVTNTLQNAGGISFGSTGFAGTGTITASVLNNTGTGELASSHLLNLNLGSSLDNANRILADTQITVNTSGAGLALINSGLLLSDLIVMNGPGLSSLTNAATGGIYGLNSSLSLNSLNNAGEIFGREIDLNIATTLTNSGQIWLNQNNANSAQTITVGSAITNQAGGIIRSGTDSAGLNFVFTNGNGVFSNSGQIFADQLALSGSNLAISNLGTGIIQGASSLNFGSSVASLQNASGAAINGLSSNLSLASLTNQGDLYGRAMDLTVTGELNNSGTIVLDWGADAAITNQQRSINAGTLVNQVGSTIQSFTGLNISLTGNAFNNFGTLLADDALQISGSGASLTLTNGNGTDNAYLQAGGQLSISPTASALTLNNMANATIYGDSLLLNTTANLSNAGRIQALNGSQLTVGTLTNTDTILLSANGSTQSFLNANILNNNAGGSLVSVGSSALNVTSQLNNIGDIDVFDALSIASFGPPTQLAVDIQGDVTVGGLFSMAANGGVAAPNVIVNTSGRIDAQTANFDLGALEIMDGGVVVVSGTTDITATTLLMNGVDSQLIGNRSGISTGQGLFTLTATNAIDNFGLIASGHDLLINANAGLRNRANAGVGAGGNNQIEFNTGGILNEGDIYGGSIQLAQMTAGSSAEVVENAESGKLDATSGVMIISNANGGFFNYGQARATGNITIAATNFTNGLRGNYSRTSVDANPVDPNGNSPPPFPYNNPPFWYDNAATQIQFEPWIALNETEIRAGSLQRPHALRNLRQEVWDTANGSDTPNYAQGPARIVSDANLSVTTNDGRNQYGILSGENVTISATGSNASFINDDLHLDTTADFYSGSLVEYGFIRNANGDIFIGADIDNPNIGGDEDATYSFDANGDIIETITSTGISSVVTDRFYAATYEGALDYGAVLRNVAVRPVGAANGRLDREKIPATSPVTTGIFANGSIVISGGFSVTNINTPYYPENGTTSATLNSLITAATTPSVEAPSNTSVGAGGNTAGTATDPSAGGGTPNESFTDPSGGTAGAADTSNQGGTGQSDYSGGASGGNGTFAGVSADYNVDAINPAGGTGSNDQSPGGSDPNSVNGPGSQNQNVTVGSGVNGAFVPGATDPTGVGGTQQQDNDPQGGSGLGNNAGGQVDGLDVGVGLVAFNGTPAIDSAAAVGVADERVSLIELSGFVPASELPPVPALELLEEQTDLNLGSTALTLPTSPNGLFVPAENIQAGFLIETNTVFDDGSNAVGSDELAEELGLDPELLQLRLGDAAYENYIIRDQITAQTNVGVLTGYQNQDQMITSLYASAAEASQDFGLVWGEALSQEQQNSLQEDIVWMVETEVGGVRVLAPVVYLSQATKLAYQNGSGMVASNVVMDVENFNNRGTVQGSNAVIIETTQGLTNQSGGTIAGNFVVLESTEGSIENANNASIIGGSSISMNANQDISNAGNVISRNIGMTAEEGGIRNAGSIRAAETAFIKGNTDVDNSRGNISGQNVFVEAVEGGIKTGGINATNTAALTARTDITVGSVEARDVGLTSHEGAVGIEFGSVTGTNSVDLSQRQSIDTTKAASNINTRNLGLTSTGGGVNLSGVDGADQSLRVQSRDDIINRDNTLESNVLSLRSTEGDISNQGGALIGTERLSLDARKDINNIGGQLSGGDVFLNAREGSITSQTLTRTTQTHGNVELGDRASITATNNLGMKAGEDINLIGSETRAGGNARFDAAGNINLLSVETRKTTSRGVESSLGNGDKTTSSVTNVGSLLDVGGTLSAEAGSEINVLGSQLNAGNAKLSAGSAINVKAVKDSVGTDTNVSRRGRFSSSESSVQTFDETVKSSGINVDGTLVMDSGKLINIEGSEVNAGQAALKSGGNIIIQSVEERHDSTVSTTKKQFIGGSSSTVVTKNGEQFGSSVNVDDALTVSSDGNTTIAASDVNVGGDFFANTGGDFTVEDRKSEKSVDTKTERSGFGVGGGMYGTQKTSDLIEESTSRGSTLNIGGSGAILSDNDVNVRGSNIDIGKDAFIDAKRDINVMDSQDTRTQTTRTETTTILAVDSSSSTGTNAQAGAEADKGNFSANASAEVGAEASNNTDISLLKTTVTNEYSYKETSRGSSIKSGGDMVLTAGETIRLKGSSLDATDNMFMESENLEVTTGRNIDISTSDTTIQKIGIFTENDASAGAEASATASLKSAKARAGASAGVEASNTTTIGYKREREETESYSLENVSSSIKSGGSTVIDVKDRAKFVGANVEAGGDIHIEAGELENLAAVDIESTDTKSSMHMGGLYVGGEASASAEAEAKAGPTGVKATAGAEASAEATAGLRYTDSHSSSSEGSTTNVVNTFSAGGNITRNVKGTIRDQGTRLAAGGNINQKATNIIEDEIRDTAWSDSSDSSRDARIGLYAGAGAEASAGGEAGLSGKSQSGVKSDASASVGLQFSYTDDSEQSKNLSTKAVTSSYTAGGNITSTSTERSKFVGSNMKAGGEGGISLSGDTVDFLAAKDTTQQSASQRSIEASGKVALIGGDDVELGAGYSQQKSNSQSSTARVGSLSAENGSVKISSRGDTNLVGVEIDAGKNVDISSSEGSTNLLAARSTAEEHREGFSISVSTSSSGNDSGGKDSEGALGFGYNRLDTASVKNTGVKIKAGNGVNLSANDKVLLEGTKVKSGKDGINISADSVELREAKDTTKTLRIGVGIDLEGSKSTSGPGGTSPDGGTDAAGNPTTASDGSGQPGAPTPASSPNDDAIKALTGATSDGAESGAASPANDDDEPEAVAGISLDFGYVDKKDGQVTELQSDGKININARKVVNQEAKLQAAEGVDMQGEEEKLERSDKNVNINLKTKFKIKSDTFKKKQEEPAADDASATDDANTASSNGTGTQNVSKSDDGGSGGGGKADANNDDAGGAATTTSSKSTNSKSDAAKASKTDDAASTGKDTTTAQNGDDASAADEEPEEYSADMSEISAPDEGLEQEDAPEIEDRDDTVDTVELAANASTKAGAPRKARPVKVVVKMPEMPNNAKITTTAKNGSKLPKWVKFDPATGVLGGTPPADFKGTINAVIQVPQLDGTIKSIPATLKIK